ncbi:putative Mg2+ transporter-C (MgtC) family protein [Pseudomonas duriflava]|uniref:Protein MgtC n=1 Tax=Pseudomonas duriflava TaxID=459528 RepID=A0A562QNR6_9PSED|nr:MgtC/SapB family protein [Pseudomonas duriflava]TWI58335.1 putative Mg2+ transporter-C (MgtC) family protein [Pseudomonas duriflava]
MTDTREIVWNTLKEELADLGDPEQATRLVLRLTLAAMLGAILGLEREQAGKAAGVRTHMLVALGSALFVLAPELAGIDSEDLSRVIQGLVTGVGFLGAGTIIKSQSPNHVKGLTTAAGIWLTAAIGMAAGTGRELSAIYCTVMALCIFFIVPRLFSNSRTNDNTIDKK